MISLAQTGLMGIAGLRAREHGHAARPGRRDERAPARLGSDARARCRRSLLTVGIGLVFGAVASRSFGIYFLMLTLTYTVIAFLFVGLGDAHRRVLARCRRRRATRPASSATSPTTGSASTYIALIVAGLRLPAHPLPGPHAVRGLAAGHPRRAGTDGVTRLQRRSASHPCLRRRRFRGRAGRRSLRVVVRAALADDHGARCDDPAARHRRDRRTCGASKAPGSERSRSSSSATRSRTASRPRGCPGSAARSTPSSASSSSPSSSSRPTASWASGIGCGTSHAAAAGPRQSQPTPRCPRRESAPRKGGGTRANDLA